MYSNNDKDAITSIPNANFHISLWEVCLLCPSCRFGSIAAIPVGWDIAITIWGNFKDLIL